ncbi:MAG: hypothetical protein GX065_09835, partial [Firmicutes bacterium]|nr:hypothetical protein [Bacillota bacterium]
VSLQYEDYEVFFRPVKAAYSRVEAGSSAAAVIYRDIYPDIDFEYIACNDFLKENIIINKYSGINSFSFLIQSPKLIPKLRDNEVYFLDQQGEGIFFIPAPYMYDKANEESLDFTVSLEHQSGPNYILTYTADEAWLTDPARVYPVVIDPVVWTKQSSSDIYDAYVEDSHKYSNFRFEPYLKSGYGSSRGKTRSYIKFRN